VIQKLIILDRDGVINEDSDDYIKSADEWIPIEGSLEAISQLKKAGYTVVIATNQSGLARGLFSAEDLQAIHGKMKQKLAQREAALDGIYFCPHGPDENCHCRKPEPGLLFKIAGEFGVSPGEMIFVGDSLRDIQAAQRAGSQPVLVRSGNGNSTLKKHGPLSGVPVYDDLAHFVRELIKQFHE
jgi:D-glycero-D-manno-heptose 1,7-bisphosphate phosphatase